jgi:hypothetical protein
MKTLKPSIALSHANAKEYVLDVTFLAETGLTVSQSPPPIYGSEIPVVFEPDPDPDMGKGFETLINILLKGEMGAGTQVITRQYLLSNAGTQVITRQYLLSKADIKKMNDIRVRVHCKHEDENHQGTSSGQYGDPK